MQYGCSIFFLSHLSLSSGNGVFICRTLVSINMSVRLGCLRSEEAIRDVLLPAYVVTLSVLMHMAATRIIRFSLFHLFLRTCMSVTMGHIRNDLDSLSEHLVDCACFRRSRKMGVNSQCLLLFIVQMI